MALISQETASCNVSVSANQEVNPSSFGTGMKAVDVHGSLDFSRAYPPTTNTASAAGPSQSKVVNTATMLQSMFPNWR